MKLKYIVREFPIFSAALVTTLVFAGLTAYSKNYVLALVELGAMFVFALATVICFAVVRKKKQKLLRQISDGLDFAGGKRSGEFPLPVLVTDENGKFVWHNHIFDDIISGFEEYSDFNEVIEANIDALRDASIGGVNVKLGEKYFTVYSQKAETGSLVLYFTENTKLRVIAEKFFSTRPAVLLITVDGIEEVQRLYKDSDCDAVKNGVKRLIENWLTPYDCLVSKRGDNTYIIFTQTGDVDKMIEKRFDILDDVRAFNYGDMSLNITLSIGVGMDGSISLSEEQAKQSLEMALGRGGDQAAVKIKDSYEFFGGVSKSVERQSKVKTRIISNAFIDLLGGCDKVFVMGHKFADLDALGSALGVAAVARAYGKESYIVINEAASLSKALLDYLKSNGFEDYILSPENAVSMAKKKALTVVVDTHITGYCECPELLEKSSSVVVIDHHRQAVDYINNAMIFYHDPSASSASELVAKLIQYLPQRVKIGSVVADALLAGIMLDTKNFVLRAGAGTFESAAFLKNAGADTVRVKKLFAEPISQYKSRSNIVSFAKEYKKCAIAVCDKEIPEIRITASQAADDLLNITGVDASFVIYKTAETVNVSARSLGKVNVQLIMEKLGGGGHQTMAAAQFKNETVQIVQSKLIGAIDCFIQ